MQAQAEALAARGDAAGAITEAQEALKVYPQFLRALSFIGLTYAQNGNPRKGAQVLTVATRLYPDDGSTHFALASVSELLGDTNQAAAEYRKTISLEKDFTAAYLNLGTIEYQSGDLQRALDTLRQGLLVDPLSAELNSALSKALMRAGDASGAKRASYLARKIDFSPTVEK